MVQGLVTEIKDREALLRMFESNWQAEMSGYQTHQMLSQHEAAPYRKALLRQLATVEKHHEQLWQSRFKDIGRNPTEIAGKHTSQADNYPIALAV